MRPTRSTAVAATGAMSTSPIDLCNAPSHTAGRLSYGCRTSFRIVSQETTPPAANSAAQTIIAVR